MQTTRDQGVRPAAAPAPRPPPPRVDDDAAEPGDRPRVDPGPPRRAAHLQRRPGYLPANARNGARRAGDERDGFDRRAGNRHFIAAHLDVEQPRSLAGVEIT